jgi:GMP synthase (glutamine-hydrolysing)
VVRHAPWEGPHRILRAFRGRAVEVLEVTAAAGPLPRPDAVLGAVLMGGPMSVNQVAEHPWLAAEIAWLRDAIAGGVPVLGVCLGAQLIARALGAEVAPAPAKEIGVAPVAVLDAGDPLIGHLAPSSNVLHWHGEAFCLPRGAVPLASSSVTPLQAFRFADAWALQFHAEADADLVELWLREPVMAAEAREVLGPDYEERLRGDAAALSTGRGDALFAEFARRCLAPP